MSSRDTKQEHEYVLDHAREQYDGVYSIRRERDYDDGARLYRVMLHGPDGRPTFWKVEGHTVTDMTRKG